MVFRSGLPSGWGQTLQGFPAGTMPTTLPAPRNSRCNPAGMRSPRPTEEISACEPWFHEYRREFFRLVGLLAPSAATRLRLTA
jgi:hypothetical protein